MAEARTPHTPPTVDWYRTPIPTPLFKRLHERSDFLAFAQTLGFLGTLATTAGLALYSWHHWAWWVTVLLVFLHGTCSSFYPNGMHELGHGTVFKTKVFNSFFTRVLSFFGWLHPDVFSASHQRHHRYTLHPPDDQEVVLPTKLLLKHFIEQGFVNYKGAWWTFKYTYRLARGRFESPWELICYPPDQLHTRVVPMRWARFVLTGHILIAVVSISLGYWMVPVVVSLAPFIGNLLFLLCNHTQHVGLQDNVPDFRLCCRTFILPPPIRFLFWHMNYHLEHHMYAAVPCYNLGKLHAAIEYDTPPAHKGIIAVWREIIFILKKQQEDPTYQFVMPIPQKRSEAPAV
jgi:fatty acid desaturase